MKKRLLSLLLILCMVCTLLPVSALAVTPADHQIQLKLVKDSTTVSGKELLRLDFEYKSGEDIPTNQQVYLKYDANKLYPAAWRNGADASSAATNFSADKSGVFTTNNFAKDDGFGGSEDSEVKFYTIITEGYGYINWKVTEPSETPAFNAFTRISSIFFGLKDGVTFGAMPKDAIKLATVADTSVTSQTLSVEVTTNNSDMLSYGGTTNTLTVDPDSLFVTGAGVTFATPATPHTHNPSSEWSYDSTHHWHACNGAGDCDQDNKLDYANHNYDKMIVGSDHLAAAATCTARASYYYSCECGANDLTQTFEDGEVSTTHHLTHHDRVAPTCTTLGKIEYWSCDVCDKNFEDSTGTIQVTDLDIPLDPINHNVQLTHNPRIEPNCHEVGRLEFWYCPNCHENFTNAAGTVKAPSDLTLSSDSSNHTGPYVYQDNPSEPAAKHDKVCQGCNTTVATEPHNNAGANGSCSVCGHGCAHVNVTHHDAVSHTCTDAGTIEYWSCNVCGQKFSDAAKTQQITDITDPEDPASHSLGKTDRVEPTCTTDGNIEYYTCSVCKNKFSDNAGTVKVDNVTIPALNHDMAPATCTKPAHCKRTGCTYTEGVALDHNFKYVDRPNQDGFIKYADLKCTNEGCTVSAKDVAAMNNKAVQATLNLDVFLKCTKAADSGEFDKNKHEKLFFYQVIKGENDIATVGFPLFTGDFSHRLNQPYTLVSGKGTNDNDALFNMRLPQREGDAWTVKMVQPDSVPTGWTIDDTEYKVYFYNDCTELVIMKKVEKQIEQGPTTDAGASTTDPTEPVPPTDPVYEFEAVTEIVFNNTFKVEKKDDPTPPTPTPVIPDGPKHTNRRYPAKPAASTDTKKPDGVTSARTFDAGVALYVGMSVLSLTGTALVIGKKKEF